MPENEHKYLDELNEAQRQAVTYVGGPELVIAGAGSGKTRVLTYKIMHLLTLGMPANRILALTFTNKAAREMRERIERLVGEDVSSRLWMGTFHSIFARILRTNADRLEFSSNFTIYDTSDTKSLIKSIIKDMKLDLEYYRPGAIMADISQAKNNLFSPEDYAADKDLMAAAQNARRPETAEIYRIYRDRCRIAGAMDFDDLLYYTNILFRDHPDVKKRYADHFSYVLVDEYQDTNFAQHIIVRQLCREKGDICVVGDDAQSIYSFRGANIRNILDLRQTFPNLKIFKLEQNYRSTRNILSAANSLIANNKEQFPKEIFSTNESGEKIEIVKCYNEFEEAYTVVSYLSTARRRAKASFSGCAVLYRTNAQSRAIEEALRNRNIPYRVFGGLAFYQRKEIKDAICYFRLAVNPNDDEALRRVINTPKRGIGDTTVSHLSELAGQTGVSMYQAILNLGDDKGPFTKSAAEKLKAFVRVVDMFHTSHTDGTNADELAKEIIETTGLLRQYANAERTPENVSKRDNLFELLKAVEERTSEAREQGAGEMNMAEFLAEVSLLTDQDTAKNGDDAVTLMTIHSAKGLEFDCVFIVGVEEELLPSGMALNSSNASQEVEEERRLMYVAITRAKKFCMASFTSQRTINGKTRISAPSRFLKEIDSRYVRLANGTRLGQPVGEIRSYRPSPSGWTVERPVAPKPVITKPVAPAVDRTVGMPKQNEGPAEFTLHTADELQCGQAILHNRFARGTIADIDNDGNESKVIIDFEDGVRRTLLLKFAKFKIL